MPLLHDRLYTAHLYNDCTYIPSQMQVQHWVVPVKPRGGGLARLLPIGEKKHWAIFQQ